MQFISAGGIPSTSPDAQRSSCWPNRLEFLLLQAGLLPPPGSVTAWEQFCASVENIEELEDGCYGLFPLVAANLQSCDKGIAHLQRITGTLRHAWANNQRLFASVTPGLRALQEAGLEFLFLKGAAMVTAYRHRNSTRAMQDVDILVRPHNLENVMAVLKEAGFRPGQEISLERLTELLRFRHEITLRGPAGKALDVHWYLVADTYDFVADDLFWCDAVPCQVAGLAGRSLNPSDQFLHTCLHGAQWNEVSPVRWLADATILAETGIDWGRVEDQARRLRQLNPVRETVNFLLKLGVALPEEIASHWQKMKPTPIEKLENGFRTRRPNRAERTKQLAWVYLRLSRRMSLGEMLRRLPGYMRQIHHFRAWSRRVEFLVYLALLVCRGQRRSI